jgi:hypothetical protein
MAITKLSNSGIKTQTNLKYDSMLAGNEAYSPTSFVSLATVVVGASPSVSLLEFTNIPQTYTHLQLRLFIRSNYASGGTFGRIIVNGDTTNANYSTHYFTGYGTGTAAGGSNTDGSFGDWPANSATANNYGAFIMDFLEYTNTNKNKVYRHMGGYNDNGVSSNIRLQGMAWKNTAAITSLAVQQWDASNFVQYTHAALYGIKVAS